MTTHSRPSSYQRSPELPIRLEGKFRPWRYGLTHSRLELRSFGPGPSQISVKFFGVVAMQMKTVFRPLILSAADSDQRDELASISGMEESSFSRAHCLVLSSTGRDSLIACIGYGIGFHPEGFDLE